MLMKSLKRTLASILTVVMMVTSVNFAFAANTNFTDVSSDYSTSVNRLSSIDIIKGYEDGTFKPEGTITRAEAATILVRMLGKESLANNSASISQFSDMSGHWANGYVNVASSAGIVIGYPDGSFGPENQVTYAEIVTMMVRSLGAGEAVSSAGIWPNNFLSFAMNESLTDDVAIVPNAPATRGDVAKIANETLDAPMWKATGYASDGTRTYEKTDTSNGGEKTLFTEKLELNKYEMYTITEELGTGALDPDQFKAEDADGNETTFTFAEGVTSSVIIGEEVDIWTNDDSDVVMIQHADDSDQKIISFTDLTDNSGTKATLELTDGTEKSYNYATGATNVIDGVSGGVGTADEDFDLPGTALINKDGKITTLNVYNYDKALVVKELKVNEDTNVYTVKADSDLPHSDTSLSYDLDTDVVNVTNAVGQTITLNDIEAGDMVMYAGANDEYLRVLQSNLVEGTVDAKDTDSIQIDGTDYDISPNFDGGSLIDSISVDDEVKAYLDAAGQIAMLDKIVGGSASGDYAIITDFYSYTDDRGNDKVKVELFDIASGETTGLKVFDAKKTDEEGTVFTGEDFYNEATDTVRNDAGLASGAYADYVGQVVNYEINSDKIVMYAVDADEIERGNNTSDFDADKEKISTQNGNFYVEGDTVKVIQATEIDSDNVLTVKTIDFATMKDTTNKEFILVDFDSDKETASYVYIPMTDSGDADNIVDTKQVINKSNSDNVGIITKIRELTGNDVEVTVMTNDGQQKFYVDKEETEGISTTAFDGGTINLDTSSDLTKFKGLLVAYTADLDSYVASENIQFSNNVNIAKFYEVNSKGEVKLLDNTDTKLTIDSFMNLGVLQSDITVTNAVAAQTNALTAGAGTIKGTTTTTGYDINGYRIVFGADSDAAINVVMSDSDKTATVTADWDASTVAAPANTAAIITAIATEIGDSSEFDNMTLTLADGATIADLDVAGTIIFAGGTDAGYAFTDAEVADTSDISETDSDITTYAAANTDEANTVYYYTVEIDDDGDLVDLDASSLENANNENAVSIMLFDPNEF